MKNIFSILLFSLLVISCDLLTTRDPEEPDKPGSNNIPATSPQILFQNLKNSINEKIAENYLACFVDSSFLRKRFSFVPASGSVTQYPVLNSWNFTSERQYFTNLRANLSQGGSITASFSDAVNTPQGDSVIYTLNYSLQISSGNPNLAGNYSGSALFKIFLDSRNQWVIVDWQDIKKENLLSWSDLKGRTY
ncbi:MAG TPA: hypothetical protein PLZ15_10940 [Melioribacteraceae bacterium]|nr:hypothetical protein [Melioribacteraceae bacterium]